MNTLNDNDIDLIQDYIDGELPDNEMREVADRLNRDADWRAEEERLRTLLRRVQGLPKSIDPGRELWHGIERRISDAPADNIVSFSRPTVYAFAAAAVVVVLASVTFVAANNGQPVTNDVTLGPAPDTAEDSVVTPTRSDLPVHFAANTDDAEYDLALHHYKDATEALYISIEERRDSMEEETWVAVSDSLKIIEQAIQDIEVALDADPSNMELRTMLVAAYEKEVGLLRQAVLL